MTHNTLHLTGFLGADRQIRTTRHGRDYAILSLATHHQDQGRRRTQWHRLVVWNVDQLDRFQALLCRKGDRIEATGELHTYQYTRNGNTHSIQRLIVEDLRILQTRSSFQVP